MDWKLRAKVFLQRLWQPTCACMTCMSAPSFVNVVSAVHWKIALQTGVATGILAQRLSTRIPMIDSNSNRAVLITMPHSHYAEKARWALDWLSLPYSEEPHAPLLHWIATTRKGGRSVPVLLHGARRFTDSTDIMV